MTRKLGLQSSSFAAFAGVLCFTVTFAFPPMQLSASTGSALTMCSRRTPLITRFTSS